MKEWRKGSHGNGYQKKVGAAILMSEKLGIFFLIFSSLFVFEREREREREQAREGQREGDRRSKTGSAGDHDLS